MKFKLLSVMTVIALVQACAVGPQYTPMSAETKQSVKSVELYNLVLQDEVKPAVRNSNVSGALGGGLIGAMIDSSVNKKRSNVATNTIKGLYDVTEDFDYRVAIATSINNALTNEFNIEKTKATAETILITNDNLAKRYAALKQGEALLYLSSFYAFVDDSKFLTTNTLAFLYTKENTKKSSSKPKPSYFNVIAYESNKVGSGSSDSLSMWGENNGELFRNTLLKATDEVAEMLLYDMQLNLPESCIEAISITVANAINPAVKHTGKLIKEENGRKLVRTKQGQLLSSARSYSSAKTNNKSASSCISEGNT